MAAVRCLLLSPLAQAESFKSVRVFSPRLVSLHTAPAHTMLATRAAAPAQILRRAILRPATMVVNR
jgi:hypothetical protein